MARLAAQARLNYYPVSERTIDLLAGCLRFSQPTAILDPCAGTGDAIAQIAPKSTICQTFGIELDQKRAEQAKSKLTTVLHASALSATIKASSFGLVWCNPPFDDELREPHHDTQSSEHLFASVSISALVPGGVFILHLPEHRLTYGLITYLTGYLSDCYQVKLSPELRPYRETIVIGKKRPSLSRQAATWKIEQTTFDRLPAYDVPAADGPGNRFHRNEPTEAEIQTALASVLAALATPKPNGKLAQPILPLSPGHLGMVLASGLLDGLITLADGRTVVVKGISQKEQYKLSEETSEIQTKSGGTKTTKTEVFSERAALKIKTLDAYGTIITYKNGE